MWPSFRGLYNRCTQRLASSLGSVHELGIQTWLVAPSFLVSSLVWGSMGQEALLFGGGRENTVLKKEWEKVYIEMTSQGDACPNRLILRLFPHPRNSRKRLILFKRLLGRAIFFALSAMQTMQNREDVKIPSLPNYKCNIHYYRECGQLRNT